MSWQPPDDPPPSDPGGPPPPGDPGWGGATPPPPPPPAGWAGGPNPYGAPDPYGAPNPYGYGAPPKVNNNMVLAILSTLLCCLPAGVVSIVYASQVNSKLAGGDYAGAVKASNSARTWAIVSAVLGLVGVILLISLSAGST